ncbi:MAG: hypothetical protein KDK70_33015, partial [Myxococcales bacterium]|nr:hypothetical protein [Myxococcales bacterium]
KVLSHHAAEDLGAIELRRHMGKSGYVPTPHRWELNDDEEDLTDDDGSVLLICGTPPGDLAGEIVQTARRHVEETGERKNYRVVGLRRTEDDDGEEDGEQVCFQFLLPASLLGSEVDEPGTGSESREHHDALMAANQQLQRQNDLLFRMLMDVVRQYPVVLGKSTELMEQLGDQLGGGRKHDLEQILAILSFEAQRDQQWMEHDRAKQRAGHKADLLGKSFEVAGPDVLMLLRKVMEMLLTTGAAAQGQPQPGAAQGGTAPAPGSASSPSDSSGRGQTQTRSQTSQAPDPAPTSAFARRLDEALRAVPQGGIAKAKALLDEDEWRLIDAARRAGDDEEFAAIFAKLQQAWTVKGEAATKALMTKLIGALGMPAAMTLGRLLEEVRGR